MAIRKKGSIKSKLVKIKSKNMWVCNSCKEKSTTEISQEGIQPSPKCPKCGDAMTLIGFCGTE